MYQKDGIQEFLDNSIKFGDRVYPWKRGVYKAPTASGKTLFSTRFIDAVKRPTLYVVERRDNLYQSQEEFQRWSDLPTGIIGDGTFEPALITFAMVQTLHHRLKELTDYFKTIEFLLYDEVHHLSNNDYHKIALKCINASIRCGISATPLVRKDLGDVLLTGDTGEIVYEADRKILEDDGYLSKARVLMFPVTSPVDERAKYKDAYKFLIVENEQRNLMILRHVKILLKKGCLVFILFRILSHGNILMELLKSCGIEFAYLSGKDQVIVRRQALKSMGSSIRVILSSTIFDESVNLPDLNAVVMAGGGASQIKSIQRCGRALRIKSSGENKAFIVDYIDKTNRYLLRHSLERLDAYRNQDFSVKIMR